MTDEELRAVVRSGVLAPSADNRHIFKVEPTADGLLLWPDDEFAACRARHRRLLGLISLGAVVENMRLHAGKLGYRSAVEWSPPTSSGALARIRFARTAVEGFDSLADSIPARCTNRRMYGTDPLSSEQMAALSEAAGGNDLVRVIWLQGPSRRRALRLIRMAESERFRVQALHEEMFGSVRFDLPWSVTSDQSIPPGALEVERPMRPLFKALRHWRLAATLNHVGLHRVLGVRAGWLPAVRSSAIGAIATSEEPESSAVRVGSAMERLWLKATQLGLAMQPLAASTVLPFYDSGPSPALCRTLTDEWREICPGGTPMLVFRLGRAPAPTNRAGRPSEHEYWVDPSSPLVGLQS